MEFLQYDIATKDYTFQMSQQEYSDIVKLTNGVYETAELQDFTALGVYTKERVAELSLALAAGDNVRCNEQNAHVVRLTQCDFLDLWEVVSVDVMGFDVIGIKKERADELHNEFRRVLDKQMDLYGSQ